MSRKNIASPDKWGRLTFLRYAGSDKGSHRIGVFQCECGSIVNRRYVNVIWGNTKSCGCLQREACRKNGMTNFKHGMMRTPEYWTWIRMKTRCENVKSDSYPEYGGRGIKICKRWKEFANFYADMGDRPTGHSIDRIDVNGDYGPENCRWATRFEQVNNRRCTMYLPHNGKDIPLTDWCRIHGIDTRTMRWRVHNWGVEKAIAQPIRVYPS